MICFEGSDKTVLYTGDFRLYTNQSNQHENVLSRKQIESLYVDLTFFDPEIRHLPHREDACRILIEFLERSKDKTSFYFKTSARVGYEFVFISLFRKFSTKIHVSNELFHLYDCLPEVQQCLTIDGSSTKFHTCSPRCFRTKLSTTVTEFFYVLFANCCCGR